MQISTSAAAAAAAAAGSADDAAKDNESEELINDTATESRVSRPLTPVERNFPPAADDSRKTPTFSARSEETVQPFGSK